MGSIAFNDKPIKFKAIKCVKGAHLMAH